MDIIKLAITCKYCQQVLDSPVVLPCGESICEKDIDDKQSEFSCFSCGNSHTIPMGGFSPNKAFALVLNTRIAELNIGDEYNRARTESFKRVQTALTDLKLSLTDPDFVIAEPIESLKRRVDLKREELKVRIDDEANALVDELTAYESECKSFHRASGEMIVRAQTLDEKVRQCEDELDAWQKETKVLKIDECKWKEVNRICERIVDDLESESNAWKDALLMNRMRDFLYKLTELESMDLKPKNKLDSKILNLKQRHELLELCDFPLNSDWKLVYRASEHGYGGAQFHAKCNHKPNTLTIIKSSSNGYVFGGFCMAAWNPVEKFIKEKNAFIFSLVNGEETPLRIELDASSRDHNAIQSHEGIGPIFGGVHINGGDRDIYIADQADANTISYSDLGRCYKHKSYPHGSARARTLLAGSFNFQVSDIEVFQRLF